MRNRAAQANSTAGSTAGGILENTITTTTHQNKRAWCEAILSSKIIKIINRVGCNGGGVQHFTNHPLHRIEAFQEIPYLPTVTVGGMLQNHVEATLGLPIPGGGRNHKHVSPQDADGAQQTLDRLPPAPKASIGEGSVRGGVSRDRMRVWGSKESRHLDRIGKSSAPGFVVIDEGVIERFVDFDLTDNVLFTAGSVVLMQGGKGVPTGGFISAQASELWAMWRECSTFSREHCQGYAPASARRRLPAGRLELWELWGIMGNYGELWGIMVELWGNYGELWGIMGELWGIMGGLWGNYGELWGSRLVSRCLQMLVNLLTDLGLGLGFAKMQGVRDRIHAAARRRRHAIRTSKKRI